MGTKTITTEIAEEDALFVEDYAEKHGQSVDDVPHTYIRRLQQRGSQGLHPEVRKMTGIRPGRHQQGRGLLPSHHGKALMEIIIHLNVILDVI
jgi:hypothetical protein